MSSFWSDPGVWSEVPKHRRTRLVLCFTALALLATPPSATAQVSVWNPTTNSAADPGPSGYTAVGDTVFMRGDDGTTGEELWIFDLQTGGTPQLVTDIEPGAEGSEIIELTPVGDRLFFVACKQALSPDPNQDCLFGVDRQLWTSDGTALGTQALLTTGEFVSSLEAMNGLLYFVACDGTVGCEIRVSDGTPEGTGVVSEIEPGSAPAKTGPLVPVRALTAVGGTLFFAVDRAGALELWKSDGTAAGTLLVKQIPDATNLVAFAAANGRLFFMADSSTFQLTLWTSDGTSAGTVAVQPVPPGSVRPETQYAVLGDTLFFQGQDETFDRELWRSDGTPAGTVRVRDIRAPSGSGGDSSPTQLTPLEGTGLFFVANDGVHGSELWRSDGTEAGTVLVADLTPGSDSSTLQSLTASHGLLYFVTSDAASGNELWRSDGTAAGTARVADLVAGPASSDPAHLTSLDGRLFFTAANDREPENVPGDPGREMWVAAVCSNGFDDDSDYYIDYSFFGSDEGCTGYLDTSERDARFVCDNGLDDDGDGFVDFPTDPGCGASWVDSSEQRTTLPCDNGLDDDGDGGIDTASDFGCDGPTDPSERSPFIVCDDGEDNDGDGAADYPSDQGCDAALDFDERTFSYLCDNGVDDDGDGLTDFPADPACESATSTREIAKCQDGADNDGDAGIDFDGGASVNGGVAFAAPDPQCVGKPWRDKEAANACGLGAELVVLLAWMRLRRRRGARGV